MYKFEVAFNDGTVGEANAKSQQPPYKVGEMAYYVKTGQEPKGGRQAQNLQRTHPPLEDLSSSNPPNRIPTRTKK